jgi:U3 small nucleolar ribonucleoprotein protein IMP3
MQKANQLVEQGHIRVGIETIMDPAFLVTRQQSDQITWARNSKMRKHVQTYNNQRDDFEMDY